MNVIADPIRVLVVEDSEDQSDLLRAYFEKAGCQVETETTAEAAIAAYQDWTPELAVIDLVLPGMDGWELVDRIRADVPDCAIAITSVLDERRYPAGTASLPKPFTRAQLLDVLKTSVPRWSAG
jgi:CheY-like chemotaxis protein